MYDFLTGEHEVILNKNSKSVVTKGNLFDLLGCVDGTYTANGLTFVITGNHIKVSGTATAATRFALSDGPRLVSGTTGLGDKLYALPNVRYELVFYNLVNNSGHTTFGLNFRNAANTANAMGIVFTAATNGYSGTPTYYNDIGQLYVFVNIGLTVDFEIDIGVIAYFAGFAPVQTSQKGMDSVLFEAKTFKHSFNNEMFLSDVSGIAITKEKKGYVRKLSATELEDSAMSECLAIYIPTHRDYVKHLFEHVVLPGENGDSWHLHRAFASNIHKDFFEIVRQGEWEMAPKIVGRPDFSGGRAHGDEIATSVVFYVDGNKIDIATFTESFFDIIKVVEKTNMYDPNDHTTIIAEHLKVYEFTKDGIGLHQEMNWLVSNTLEHSYITMLPILRGNDASSVLQITDTAYDDVDYTEYDISVGGFTGPPFPQKQGVKKFILYSNVSGVSAEVELVSVKPEIATAWGNIYNTVNVYNKVYFAMQAQNTAVTAGDKWEIDTLFKINVK